MCTECDVWMREPQITSTVCHPCFSFTSNAYIYNADYVVVVVVVPGLKAPVLRADTFSTSSAYSFAQVKVHLPTRLMRVTY